jgi:pimeloyl-ACP methyl ester carboxylesterase
VFQDDQWKRLAAAIRKRHGDNGGTSREPLVLIGHSYGADDSIRIARELEKSGIDVDLLILMDPVTPPPVPLNVRACRNYYQSNGAADALPWLRGVAVKPAPEFVGRLDNIDLRRDRTDLLESKTNHFNIEKNEKLHAAIIEEVLATCPRRRW